ncbi:MAG: hypothetical protein N2202_06705 [Proteobacteria bacterium]|nr:hypothetical protein [Pseudomonadota bacterium]
MNKKFDYKTAIEYGWDITKNNAGILIGTSAFSGVIVFISYIIANLSKDNIFLNFTFGIGAKLIEVFLIMGFMKITLKIIDWEKPVFTDLFSCIPLIFKYFIANLLYFAIVCVGLIFFIIPGFYLAVKYQFYDYFIVDEENGPIEALQNSAKITKGVKWELIKLSTANLSINLIGFVLFFIGLIVTFPITIVARSYVYKRLLQSKNNMF